ncbi:lysophospholipase [Luteolibacter flavescens]|uniref:Lysophospholipase n=1 Tax=Luteolibacter flavescens TaxID=1859460 RepID=A0ABT3FI20_9BACT|nr:lysophospholipase [Luteolibacter flavescens]MCW1883218.1 lysophospholipase [Luteolibacter flavescens]
MKRLRRLALRLLAIFALLLAVVLAVAGWWGSGRLISPQRRGLQDYHREILAKPADFGLQVQPFVMTDETPGLLVTGIAEPGPAEKGRALREELNGRGIALPPWGSQLGTIVMFYGHSGRKEDHLPICERFCAAGFRCLLVDIPGQGDHPGTVGSFGLLESGLASQALAEASAKFDFPATPAFLFGVSQGGSIALLAAASEPAKWSGVASVATFASLDRPVLRSAEEIVPEQLRFCCPLAAFSVGCATKMRAGYWPADVRPVEAAAKLHLPVMIAHGDRDPYIGIEQGIEIFAAIPDSRKQFRVVEGADHNRVLATGSTALYADLCQFFLKSLEPATAAFERTE